MIKFTLEENLKQLEESLYEQHLYVSSTYVSAAIETIAILRDRIDELGGYHDDV